MTDHDVTMMYSAHQAFRRNLERLAEHPDPARWREFRRQLKIHHTAEDTVLWPSMRRRGVDPRLIDAMDAEHAKIDPLLEAVDDSFSTDPGPHLKDLLTQLDAHLTHEETQTLALITDQEWRVLDREMRRRIGVRNLRAYFRWLLEDAPPTLRAEVRAALPAPARLLLPRAR